jgi:hypothetical protein
MPEDRKPKTEKEDEHTRKMKFRYAMMAASMFSLLEEQGLDPVKVLAEEKKKKLESKR